MNLPIQKYTNNSEEIDDLLKAIQKTIFQRDASELLRLSFICSDLYGLHINKDGSLTPINK